MSTVAYGLAAAHPQAKLPCPICANTVNASNLSSHVTKVHADVAALADWRGRRWSVLPARLALADGAIELRALLGRRRVALPCAVVVGSLVTDRVNVINEYEAETVKTGWYMRLGESITIGCRTAANVKAHWKGWTQGKRRRITDVVVDRRVLVEIEYALAAAGALEVA